MPTDTRSAVAEAIERLSAEPAESTDTGTTEPIEPAGDSGSEVEATPSSDADQASPGRDRDDKGRFAKGTKEPAAPAREGTPKADAVAGQGPVDGAPPPAPSAAPALPELKPPQDWRAAARDKWGTTPREAQEEAIRLYGETRKTLDRAAALEKEQESWRTATQPYAHVFRGAPPQQVVGTLLSTLATLETGHPQARAQILANLARNYLGTDESALRLLASAIEGSPQTSVAAPPAMNPEQIRQLARQEWQQAQQEQGLAAAIKTWQEFEPTAALLGEEGVRADLVDLAGKWVRENPGQQPTKEVFQKLYDRACLMNEGAAKIVNQRKEAAAVKAKNGASTSAAASGVKNEPAGPTGGEGPAKSTREEVARQFKRARQARI